MQTERPTDVVEQRTLDSSRFTIHDSRFTFHASRLADIALLIVALIWGATFVMVKNAVAGYPVLSFLALRFGFAALVMLPVLLLRRNRRGPESPTVILSGPASNSVQSSQFSEESPLGEHGDPGPETLRSATASGPAESGSRPQDAGASELHPHVQSIAPVGELRVTTGEPPSRPRTFLLAAPLLMGLALFAGYALQTFGLRLTTPAKAGFITGLSVVIVPVVSTLLLRQRISGGVWLGVGLATVGLALLSLQADLSMSTGDLLVLGCAVAFACQILLTGRFAPSWDPLLLTFWQIVVVALTAGVAAMLLERPLAPTGSVLFAAAFTGILATSLAFGVQTVAQRHTSPTRTALIFATEPVFAALFSFLLIGEVLGPRQLVGCALILAGMIVAERLRAGRGTA